MVDSMLTDKDIAIHLMNDKLAGEGGVFPFAECGGAGDDSGQELKLPAEDIRTLGIGSMFHDIGKVEIPDKILLKTDPLTRAEADSCASTFSTGWTLARKVGLSTGALAIIAQHHEYASTAAATRKARWLNGFIR